MTLTRTTPLHATILVYQHHYDLDTHHNFSLECKRMDRTPRMRIINPSQLNSCNVRPHVISFTASQSTPVEFAFAPTDSAFYYILSPLVGYLLYTLLSPQRSSISKIHPSKCLVNNVVPPLPLRAAPRAALPPPLLARRPLPSSIRRLTRLLPTPSSSSPCTPLPSRALAPASSARWLPPQRKSTLHPLGYVGSFPTKSGLELLPENRALTFSQRCRNRLLRRPRHWRLFRRRWFQCPR